MTALNTTRRSCSTSSILRPSRWPQMSIRRCLSLFLVVSMSSTVSSALYFAQSLLLILFVLTHLVSTVIAIFIIVEISVITQNRQPFDIPLAFRFNKSCSTLIDVADVLKFSCYSSAVIFSVLMLFLIIALLLCLDVNLHDNLR
ncbi:hypothetical protein BOX15_Mlig016741g2 [Macrostomum lignano]|uniref:Uncharacterized protein n=1 Tax=Macrostomum lignano TaxID=282301 RepID=A0A267DM51_9PLAT|nr:hypothetical protein BOX15_Mlig016741g2 [Macrostomum lignano]